MRLFILLSTVFLALAGCANTPGGNRLMSRPDFELQPGSIMVADQMAELGLITAGHSFNVNQEWSDAAGEALTTAYANALSERGLTVIEGPTPKSDGDVYLLRNLLGGVRREGFAKRKSPITTSVAPTLRELSDIVHSDYLLVGEATGGYSSSGRNLSSAAGVVLAAGLGIGYVNTVGGQYLIVGLIELESQQIVWVNKMDVSGRNLRNPNDAPAIVEKALQDFPKIAKPSSDAPL